MPARLNVVTLGVSDLARSRRFYEALGYRASSTSNEHIVFFDGGAVVFALFSRAALAKDADVDAQGSGFAGFALARNVGSKPEVDAALADAQRAGARILKAAQEVFWGGYSGYFADPDGFTWEVAFNPHWPLDHEGIVELPR